MTDSPDEPTSAVSNLASLTPGSLEWRLVVARSAHQFFNPLLPARESIAKRLNKAYSATTFDIWNVNDFTSYLQKEGLQMGEATVVPRILAEMERAGLLISSGWEPSIPLMGQRYVSQGQRTAQASGNLWLSSAIGPDLIIESYKAVTVLISGKEGRRRGSGLILDRTHLITNKHVLQEVAGPEMQITVPLSGSREAQRDVRAVAHPTIDIAVIELQVADNDGFGALPGMAFRDPAWADELYLLGYPRVPWMVGDDITLQRGEVVNPMIEVPPVRDDQTEALGIVPERGKAFLYSAIARPGNSGGPIVAHDGRVVGLVVEDSDEYQSTDARRSSGSNFPTLSAIWRELQLLFQDPPDSTPDEPPSAPFYRGIRASEVVRAVEELSPDFGGRLDGVAVLEN